MRKLREILRLKYAVGRTHREIAKPWGSGRVPSRFIFAERARVHLAATQ